MTSERPLLRIVSGNPTPEEIAIVAAVLTATGGDSDVTTTPPSQWARPTMRVTTSHGPSAWRASGLPHE